MLQHDLALSTLLLQIRLAIFGSGAPFAFTVVSTLPLLNNNAPRKLTKDLQS
jgi:hypothetical protein